MHGCAHRVRACQEAGCGSTSRQQLQTSLRPGAPRPRWLPNASAPRCPPCLPPGSSQAHCSSHRTWGSGTRARGPAPRAGLCTAPSGTAQHRGLRATLWGRSPKERRRRGRWCCAHAGRSSAQRRSELCSRARCTHTSVPRVHSYVCEEWLALRRSPTHACTHQKRCSLSRSLHMQKAPSLLHPLRLRPSLASRERFTYSLAHEGLRGETAVDLLPSPLPASETAPQSSAALRRLP